MAVINNNALNVSYGKPKVGGAVYVAPIGTTLPTNATAALDEAFVNLGYCSEDGMTNSMAIKSEEIKAWGGDTVLRAQTSFDDTFGLTLIETLRLDVLKTVFGSDNVSGALNTGISVAVNGGERQNFCWVVDTILTGNVLRRFVVPIGKITEIAEITYKDNEAIGYGLTIGSVNDTAGNTHYEYTQAA